MSALELIAAYLRQRARLRVLLPLSILAALAGSLFISTSTVGATASASLEALGVVLAFRVWDDLEDREIDRVRHPDRVLATAATMTPFYLLGLALSTAAIIPLVASGFALRRLAALSLAVALLSIWYGVRSEVPNRHALGEHLLALKYPLVAYAVAPQLPDDVVTPRTVVILALLYALVCAYEYAEDDELRQIFTSRRSIS